MLNCNTISGQLPGARSQGQVPSKVGPSNVGGIPFLKGPQNKAKPLGARGFFSPESSGGPTRNGLDRFKGVETHTEGGQKGLSPSGAWGDDHYLAKPHVTEKRNKGPSCQDVRGLIPSTAYPREDPSLNLTRNLGRGQAPHKSYSRQPGPGITTGRTGALGLGLARTNQPTSGAGPGVSNTQPNYVSAEGEGFYGGLPSPWNVLPSPAYINQSDYMKMMFQHSFSGKLEDYETFRGLFIPIKHAVDVPIALKHYALASSLKGQAQDLVQGTLPTAAGYALLINRLEENYGGVYRQLDRGMDRIRRLKEVRPG